MHDENTRMWRIGELAAVSGLSVRALRHYDELGLLVPAERSASGYRLYSVAEVERLYRITALRRLGLGLEAIGAALDGDGASLAEVVRRQREAVDRELAERVALRDRLDALCAELDRGEEPTVQELITTMEAMQMYEKYFDSDQRAQIRERGESLGPERIAQAEADWAGLFEELRGHLAAGTDPADPALEPIRARGRELIGAFAGGDPGISQSLGRMWRSEDPEQLSRGTVDREVFAYWQQVCAADGGMG
jgi:DNA-binding transcriptional MerR regulator